VTAIRTVIVTIPPMFRDLIIHLMAKHDGLDVVEEFTAREGLEERLPPIAPDLVLVGLARNEGDEIGLSLVRRLPTAKVIAFSSDGRHAFVHGMQPQRTELLDVSPQALIKAIIASHAN